MLFWLNFESGADEIKMSLEPTALERTCAKCFVEFPDGPVPQDENRGMIKLFFGDNSFAAL
jgi:hypothetical protein